ncbi:MAG TPA: LysR substrate-binding domain-containing protein [Verrucomicrobiae bacterium]|jgi:DNA-binding transcriptional LysR family regulator
MELRHLRYFVAVAEELNIRRAAVRLHISQPPLTRQIRDLEDEIGVKLFERSKIGVLLTDAGRVFLAEARQIVSHSERAARLARGTRNGETSHLNIAVPPMALDRVLSRVMRQFRRRFPHLALQLLEMSTPLQFKALADKNIDLGYCAFRSADPELAFKPVRRAAICAVLPPGHFLARQRRLPLNALAEEGFIAPRRHTGAYYDWYINLCRDAGFEPKIVQEADSAQNILNLASAGVGVALVPEPMRRFQSATDVEIRDIFPNTPYLTFHLAWHRNNPSPSLKSFLEMFAAHTDFKSNKK